MSNRFFSFIGISLEPRPCQYTPPRCAVRSGESPAPTNQAWSRPSSLMNPVRTEKCRKNVPQNYLPELPIRLRHSHHRLLLARLPHQFGTAFCLDFLCHVPVFFQVLPGHGLALNDLGAVLGIPG